VTETTVAIEAACARLVVSYTHLVDGGRAADIADLFAENGVWSSPQQRMKGRAALRAGFASRQAQTERTSRHVCTNLLVDVVDADHATGLVYLSLYRHDGDDVGPAVPALIGDYRDTFVRTPDGWRFDERHLTVAFAGARP